MALFTWHRMRLREAAERQRLLSETPAPPAATLPEGEAPAALTAERAPPPAPEPSPERAHGRGHRGR